MKNLKIEKEVEERCNKYFSKYEKWLDEMESKLDKKADLDEVKALIEENKESAATGGNDQDGTLTSQLEEFKENMARKSNIKIFRAEESKKTEPKERKVEDIAITGTNKQTIKNVIRLGKKNVEGVGCSKYTVNSQVLTETNVNKVMDFNGIECFYTNADSLPNKLGELITRIQDGKNSYEVIGIT